MDRDLFKNKLGHPQIMKYFVIIDIVIKCLWKPVVLKMAYNGR